MLRLRATAGGQQGGGEGEVVAVHALLWRLCGRVQVAVGSALMDAGGRQSALQGSIGAAGKQRVWRQIGQVNVAGMHAAGPLTYLAQCHIQGPEAQGDAREPAWQDDASEVCHPG